MLDIFRKECVKNSRNSTYQFWRQNKQSMELYSGDLCFSKDELHPSESG